MTRIFNKHNDKRPTTEVKALSEVDWQSRGQEFKSPQLHR